MMIPGLSALDEKQPCVCGINNVMSSDPSLALHGKLYRHSILNDTGLQNTFYKPLK